MRIALLCFSLQLFLSDLAFAHQPLPELKIQKIDEGVYLHTSFQRLDGFGLVDSNGLVVLDNNDAYIIDTPWSAQDTQALVQWIDRQGLSVKGSVSTHFHEDRTAGIGWLNSRSIPTYASELTNALLKKAGKTAAVTSFDKAGFWLVPDLIEVYFPGGGHSPDNVVVWLPESNILFGGCLVRPNETDNLGNVGDAVIGTWSESVQKLASRYKHAKLVVPGHGNVGTPALLTHTRDLADAATK